MEAVNFKVKPYPEMWKGLDMDVERFDKARQMLGEVYGKMFISQPNRPKKMEYFDSVISEIFGSRIEELLDAKKEGRPAPEVPDITGTFGAALHGAKRSGHLL